VKSSPRKINAGKSGGLKRWLAGISLAVVAVIVFAYFFLGPRDYSNDPRVVEIREIQEEATMYVEKYIVVVAMFSILQCVNE